MLIWFIVLLIALIVNSRRTANDEWLSKEMTTAVNGFFILWVFLRHGSEYITASGYVWSNWLDMPFVLFNSYFGHCVVAMFLFNSGYGVLCRILNKKGEYVSSMPTKRILPVLFNFDIAVLLFIIIGLLIGRGYSIRQCILSLLAWDDVGNSNWYIFSILACYIATWISFTLMQGRAALITLSLVMTGYVLVMSCVKPFFWYDMVLCYAAGAWVAFYRNKICELLLNHYFKILFITAIACVAFRGMALFVAHAPIKGILLNLHGVCFAMFVAALLFRISVGNAALLWAGKNLFPLYIYQRIPMILLSALWGGAWISKYPYMFIIGSAVGAVGAVALYGMFQQKKGVK